MIEINKSIENWLINPTVTIDDVQEELITIKYDWQNVFTKEYFLLLELINNWYEIQISTITKLLLLKSGIDKDKDYWDYQKEMKSIKVSAKLYCTPWKFIDGVKNNFYQYEEILFRIFENLFPNWDVKLED